ncbi:MAG TPA: hypothetical protein DDZ53_03905 [Firmicutes bacterium]|jgi:Tfp pilus assembly protein PilN|nr:hypothetical protein [Bacillota bacterium]
MQPINLLPDLRTRRRERLQLSLPRILVTAAMLWLTVLASVYGGYYWRQRTLQSKLQVVTDEIEALEPVAQHVTALQELATAIESLRELLDNNAQGVVVPAIDLVASLMPAEIRAQQITVDQVHISVACYSTSLAPIGQLYSNLQQTQQFSSIQFSAISSVQQSPAGTRGGYAFSVTLELQGVDP